MGSAENVWAGLGVVAAFALGLIGCSASPKESERPAGANASTAQTVDQQVARYRECWGLFNDRKWEAFAGCYASTATSEQMGTGAPEVKGPSAIIEAAKSFAQTFPDNGGTLRLVLARDQTFVALAVLNGTQTGALPGSGKAIPATGKPVGFMMGHVIEWDARGDKAVRERAYQDSATILSQIGASKMPARAVMVKPAGPPTVVVASGSEIERKNLAAFNAQLALFNTHDIESVSGFNAPDAVYHDFTSPADMNGKENRDLLAGFFQGFSDCQLVISSAWAAGDYVVAQGTFEGTNDGPVPMMGIATATKQAVKVPYLEITKYEDGKIKEDWLIYESMAFAQQLGLM